MDNGFNGLILYNIELNGNLSGVYLNETMNGNISQEIATKLDNNNSIVGNYRSINSQGIDPFTNFNLTISQKQNRPTTLEFVWTESGNIVYSGIGYLMQQNKIVVHYWRGNLRLEIN